jgi:3D (Asp-Asp-Asp) domain-containing protein
MMIVEAVVTAYCGCVLCCGKWAAGGVTASGARPVEGITVAAPRRVPLGSSVRIHLPGGGWHTFTAQDRTARQYDGRYDIFFADHRRAIRFGKRRLKVETIR